MVCPKHKKGHDTSGIATTKGDGVNSAAVAPSNCEPLHGRRFKWASVEQSQLFPVRQSIIVFVSLYKALQCMDSKGS